MPNSFNLLRMNPWILCSEPVQESAQTGTEAHIDCRFPGAMSKALEAHDKLLREVVKLHFGYEVGAVASAAGQWSTMHSDNRWHIEIGFHEW